MRIGLETNFMNRSITGIANYTYHIVRAILERDASFRFMGFGQVAWQPMDSTVLDGFAAPAHGDDDEEIFRSRQEAPRSLWELSRTAAAQLARVQTLREAYRSGRRYRFMASIRSQSLDLFHAFNYRPPGEVDIPVIPVVYDLSTFRHPEFHPADRVRYLAELPRTLSCAPLVQTISEFSKAEIVSVFGYPPEKIFVATPAANEIFHPRGEELTQSHLDALILRTGKYFLAVGTLEPRKNIRTLISAYAALPPADRSSFPLVIAGGAGWGNLGLPKEAMALIGNGSIRFVGSVPNARLRSLYEGARIFLMPSLYEGFGMPVVEALACGTPVAHSADTSMDEISGNIGKRVAALDVDGWTDVLKGAIDNNDHADPVRREARIARARQFDWKHSAGLVVDAYRRILN